jgi:DNA topoisomerase VI subunit B
MRRPETSTPKLQRSTFSTSRLLEYFSVRELEMQIGCDPSDWPLALTKELIDNALDACESWDKKPVITVLLDESSITVCDNGPGLPESTLKSSLDYTSRTSDKAHYVSPTRGQLGNALKCLWAAPFVLRGSLGLEEVGRVEIVTDKFALEVTLSVNKIAQCPDIRLNPLNKPFVKTGTIVKTEWPFEASLKKPRVVDFYKEEDEESQEDTEILASKILHLLQSYASFNPHADFFFNHGGSIHLVGDAVVDKCEKWRSDSPTSPHWYSIEDLRNLIAAYISNGEGTKTVRALVSEFRGLTGSAKQMHVLRSTDLTGKTLNEIVRDENVDLEIVERLLTAMCEASHPVKAEKLGLLGESFLIKRIIEMDGVVPESVRYVKLPQNDPVRPTMVEVAFGLRPESVGDTRVRFGLNFSPALNIPLRTLSAWLQYDQLIDPDDAACLLIHASCPRFEFTSRAKSMLT